MVYTANRLVTESLVQIHHYILIKKVILQHHDSVVTSTDLGLALHCQYDLSNRSVSTGELSLEVQGEIQASIVQGAEVQGPQVVMGVTQRGGAQVTRAQVSRYTGMCDICRAQHDIV